MPRPSYRALIVDDEPAIRNATARALLEEGFACDQASDGKAAVEQVGSSTYDVIITDLKMPEMNGHALAVHLLNRSRNRPKVVVQTGIVEPRLARDLFARGVDDIIYKPFDQRLLAMKLKRLLDSSRQAESGPNGPDQNADATAAGKASNNGHEITMQDLDRKLAHVSRVLPVSQAAIDVFQMVSTDTFNAREIGVAIQRDPALAVEVLRIANTAHYNPAGKRIASLEQAVTRIGQRRIAELAIATNALSAITAVTLPWLDTELTWRRSLAAGVAAELLIEQGGHERIDHGLILCATMHPVGRVVVGTLYPEMYPSLLDACRQKGTSLFAEEAHVLPANHARIMSKLLKLWNIPLDVYLPLAFARDDPAAIARLGEPMRTRIELIRCAMLIGNIAAGRWHPWDVVECPSGRMLHRLNICAVGPIIAETRERMEQLLRFRHDVEASSDDESAEAEALPELDYVSYTDEAVDTLQHTLVSLGFQLRRSVPNAACGADVVNCLDLPSEGTKSLLAGLGECRTLIADKDQPIRPESESSRLVHLPVSQAAFVASLQLRECVESHTPD